MYSITKSDNNTVYGVNEYVCDCTADLNSLPHCKPGSTAIVLEEGNAAIYVKNAAGKWVKL